MFFESLNIHINHYNCWSSYQKSAWIINLCVENFGIKHFWRLFIVNLKKLKSFKLLIALSVFLIKLSWINRNKNLRLISYIELRVVKDEQYCTRNPSWIFDDAKTFISKPRTIFSSIHSDHLNYNFF